MGLATNIALSLLTYLLRRERSTHSLISSVSFLGVTTIGAHNSVGSVTGAIISFHCWRECLQLPAMGLATDIAFSLDIFVEAREVYAQSDIVCIFLGSDHNWRTPLSRFCDRCYYTLLL